MLHEIKQILRDQSQCSLLDISRHFHKDPSVIEPMLELLIRKGHVRQVHPPGCDAGCYGPACASCICANRAAIQFYELAG